MNLGFGPGFVQPLSESVFPQFSTDIEPIVPRSITPFSQLGGHEQPIVPENEFVTPFSFNQ